MSYTKEIIKKNALEIFALEGYDRASLSKISQKSGTKKSSIYTYYSSKDDLFAELLSEQIYSFINYFKRSSVHNKDEAAYNKLFSAFETYINYFNKNRIASKFILRYWLCPDGHKNNKLIDNEKLIKENNDLLEVIRKLILNCIDEGKIKEDRVSIDRYVESFYWFCKITMIKMVFYDRELCLEDIKAEWDLYFNGIGST